MKTSSPKERRRQQRQLTSAQRHVLLAEYVAFPDDQPLTELHAAARLRKSRAWCQIRRITGGGPRYYRTNTGRIFYMKRDVEAYLSATLTAHNSTSEYPAVPLDGNAS